MSKQLIKILSICALIVLVPLIVVAASLTVTEAVGCTLTIFEGGIEQVGDTNYEGKSSEIKIFVDGEEQGTTVKLKKYSEVTVTYAGVGYDFDGWYNCNYEEIKGEENRKSTSASYTFELSGNTILTAVRNVRVYDEVVYTGYYDDDITEIVDTQLKVVYGQPLKSITSVSGATFLGWCEADENGNIMGEPTMVANFASSQSVRLVPAWSSQMLLQYLKGDVVIASRRLTEASVKTYTLLTADDAIVQNNVTKGYEFVGWLNQADNQTVTSIVFDANGINLVMNESLVTYTLNVKYNALSSETSQITYNVRDGFGSYNQTRSGYTLTAFNYNGTDYAYSNVTFEGLADAIIENGSKTAEVTAVWTSNYSPLYMTFYADSIYQKDGDYVEGQWPIFGTINGQNDQYVEVENQRVVFEDKVGDEYFDLQDNAYDYLMSGYSNLHKAEGDAVTFTGKVMISIDGTLASIEHTISGTNITFKDILDLVDYQVGLANATNVTVSFIFA